jgi:L-ascorbate metabolism protein UlaG (beta-lactamase superfamily)
MRLRWLGTAGFELHSGDTALLIDPYMTRNPRAKPVQPMQAEDLLRADAILVSHGHFDHVYDIPVIAENTGAMVFCSPGVSENLRLRGVPWRQVASLDPGASARVGDVQITAIASRHVHFDVPLVLRTLVRSLPAMPAVFKVNASRFPTGGVYIYLIEAEGKRILHMGSAHLEADSLPAGDIDVFLVPVQGRSDIQKLAARLTSQVAPRLVIPHHHDDFYPPISRTIDLQPFLKAVDTMVLVPELNRWIDL